MRFSRNSEACFLLYKYKQTKRIAPVCFQTKRDKHFLRKGRKEGRKEAQKKVDELQKKIDELQKQNAVLQIDKNVADLNQGTADGAMANRRQGWSATTSSALTPEDSSLVKDVLAMEDQNEQH